MPTAKDAIILDDKAQSLAHYPHARRAGDLLFLCGTSSRKKDNSHIGVHLDEQGVATFDVAAQTEAVLENMRDILQAAGGELTDLIDLTTFLVDMKDFKEYNTVYNRFFTKETGPARTTVAVHQLPHPHLRIEIKGIAYLPQPTK